MISFFGNKYGTMVCTNIEQSNRLIELGINPNTADMGWHKAYSLREEIYKPYIKGYKLENHKSDIPAWTLYKLIQISGAEIAVRDEYVILNNSKLFKESNNVYNNLIDVIEFLIEKKEIDTINLI